ncbi:MAG: DUF2062 domain-containing protein [Nitrospirae bacterium]|nr:DUF2062 domain-containing protein [Nitrospirota bacterium]
MHLRDRLRQILSIGESPGKIAAAFSLGVFIGMSPLLGLHTILGIAVAWALKLNRLVTLAGVFVTNPWTIIPIYTLGTWLGAKLLMIDHIMPDIDWSNVTINSLMTEFSHILMPFLVGNTVLGLLSATVSYFLIFQAVKRARE